jgi:hypothetical protein
VIQFNNDFKMVQVKALVDPNRSKISVLINGMPQVFHRVVAQTMAPATVVAPRVQVRKWVQAIPALALTIMKQPPKFYK